MCFNLIFVLTMKDFELEFNWDPLEEILQEYATLQTCRT